MADHLEAHADAIVERWVDWLQEGVDTRATKGLPRQAIRNHMPPVLRSIASYLRSPIAAAQGEMLGHLELHARLRRAQGYDLRELLAEVDGLAQLVTAELRDRVPVPDPPPTVADTLRAFERVATGLRAIGFVTVDLFRESEADERQRLAERLEEFSRTIAHELRTPLQTASLSLQLVREADDAERRDHHLHVVESSLARAADLIDNLRQLALIEGGRARSSHFDRARSLLEETLEEVGPLARDRDVQVMIEGDVPDVTVDRLVFQLAFVNILGNAVKYSDPAKGERWIRVTMAMKPVEADLDRLVVTVEDNGRGIAEEYVGRVFQRHVRAHPEAAEGTGLGLAITRQLVEERGGAIRLESREGEGTTLVFELPSHPGEVTRAPTVGRQEAAVAQAVRGLEPEPER